MSCQRAVTGLDRQTQSVKHLAGPEFDVDRMHGEPDGEERKTVHTQ